MFRTTSALEVDETTGTLSPPEKLLPAANISNNAITPNTKAPSPPKKGSQGNLILLRPLPDPDATGCRGGVGGTGGLEGGAAGA